MNPEHAHAIAAYYANWYDIERLAFLYETTKGFDKKCIGIAVKIQCGVFGQQLELL